MSLSNILLRIQQEMNRYFCPICLIFGIIGCLLNILLFSQKQFRNISCCTYFLAASISMITTLILGFGPHAYSVNHPNPVHTISSFCKIRSYVAQSFMMIHRWLMAMACIDRYMVSSINVKLREFANPNVAYRIIIIIMIIFIILPLHNLFFLDIKNGMCVNSIVAFTIYHSLFTIIFGGFLPLLIMITFVILIRHNLATKQQRRQRDMYKIKGSTVRLLNSRDYQALMMLFVQVIFYILSTIPWMIFLIYAPFGRRIHNKSNNRIAIEKFFRYITEILVYTYPTLSFYINIFTSQTFRDVLVNILCSLLTSRERFWYRSRLSLIRTQTN
ncbi:unnamed protein product [Adineta steineri]|uniref:G-protein coupled receptors family 1 profile domain-containing protein n=2 Tax=Adineta steineri TaxID=433720 RepID=A0A815JMS5_9BILA|nr:unnamed protein product [Adineta steineri]